jgi:hypothetical protein
MHIEQALAGVPVEDRPLAALRVLGTRTRATHEPRLRNPTKRKGGDAMNAARTRGSREDDETHID